MVAFDPALRLLELVVVVFVCSLLNNRYFKFCSQHTEMHKETGSVQISSGLAQRHAGSFKLEGHIININHDSGPKRKVVTYVIHSKLPRRPNR